MIFVDSGAIIAYFRPDDVFHAAATTGFARLESSEERAATTSLCVAESLAVLAHETGDFAATARAGLDILQWEMEVIRPTLLEERRALKLMESYSARKIGYVDCVSFAVMDARGMRVAFTFDEAHFVKLRKLDPWVPIRRRRART